MQLEVILQVSGNTGIPAVGPALRGGALSRLRNTAQEVGIGKSSEGSGELIAPENRNGNRFPRRLLLPEVTTDLQGVPSGRNGEIVNKVVDHVLAALVVNLSHRRKPADIDIWNSVQIIIGCKPSDPQFPKNWKALQRPLEKVFVPGETGSQFIDQPR